MGSKAERGVLLNSQGCNDVRNSAVSDRARTGGERADGERRKQKGRPLAPSWRAQDRPEVRTAPPPLRERCYSKWKDRGAGNLAQTCGEDKLFMLWGMVVVGS